MTERLPAIVTAAGAATRFRPFSACVPKEMLPLGGTPALGLVVRECLLAGATDVIVVTRPGDAIVPDYADALRGDGYPVSTVVEDLAHGYGNATPLLTVRDQLASCKAFLVAFGDDVLLGERSTGINLAAMTRQLHNGSDAVVAAQLISHSAAGSFGIIDTDRENPSRMVNLRQRPHPSTVGEPLAVVSRLALRPAILDRIQPSADANGEVDLGVAVARLATEGHVGIHRVDGTWVTVGDPRHYHEALNTYWQLQQQETLQARTCARQEIA